MRLRVHGIDIDPETRCKHWRSERDVVAIRMKCCGLYYACKDCHAELAGHPIAAWPEREWDAKAVLCGKCGHEMTIREYLDCADACPACAAPFNPGCKLHRHFYFDVASG